MTNLEKLSLYFETDRNGKFIDGNDLKDIRNSMSRLKKFRFNIRTIVQCHNPQGLLTNEEISRTFENFEKYQIISCVNYFPKKRYGHCHIYSYPYTLKYYEDITNNFPGGLFPHVQEVTLFDEYPFEHEFFMKISQSFPFVQTLTVTNSKPQNSNDDYRTFPLIKYSHLTSLCLLHVHDHYVEQFLFDTKMFLPNFVRLSVDYHQLERVTHHFTRDAIRNNCAKIKKLCHFGLFQLPKHYRSYFPHLE